MAVACAAAVLCSGAARALLTPLQCWRVLLSCNTLLLAKCCGVVWVCVCAVRVVGYTLSALPLVVVEGGAIVDGGVA